MGQKKKWIKFEDCGMQQDIKRMFKTKGFRWRIQPFL